MSTDQPAPSKFSWSYLSTFEPAVLRGLWVTLVGLLTAFGLQVSDAIQAKATAIIAAAAVIVPLVQAFWTRQAVSPVAKLEQLEQAVTTPMPNSGTITSGGGNVTVSIPGVTEAAHPPVEPSPMPMATGGGYQEPPAEDPAAEEPGR